jgi:hypothetical protein
LAKCGWQWFIVGTCFKRKGTTSQNSFLLITRYPLPVTHTLSLLTLDFSQSSSWQLAKNSWQWFTDVTRNSSLTAHRSPLTVFKLAIGKMQLAMVYCRNLF